MPVITATKTRKSPPKQEIRCLHYVQLIQSYKPQRFFMPQGYFASPSQQQLFHLNGKCDYLVIANAFGRAEWKRNVDLSRLAAPLGQTVLIADREIEVYFGDRGKPSEGMELNRPCLVTLKSLQPIDHSILRQMCNNNGTRLIKFGSKNQEFTILIPHFTRYSFNSVQLRERQLQERRRRSQPRRTTFNKRKRLTQQQIKANLQQLNFNSMKPEYQIFDQPQRHDLSIGGGKQVMNGFMELVLGKGNKFFDRQLYFPRTAIIQNQEALAIQNQNRAQHHFPKYQHSPHHTTVLQNVLISADGEIVELKKYESYQKITFKGREKPDSVVYQGFYTFLKSQLDLSPQSIQSVVCGWTYRPQIKRLFSLYAILFSTQLSFTLNSTDSYQPKSVRTYLVSSTSRVELIKNWLSWVIKSQYQKKLGQHLPIKTRLMQALLLRRPQHILDNLIVQQKWTEAELVCNLQDNLYRQRMPKNLQFDKQIELALKQLPSQLEFTEWVLSFGFSAFYFKKKSLVQNLALVMASQRIKNKKQRSFGLQFRLFQLYLFQQGLSPQTQLFQPEKPNRQELCLLWILNNDQVLRSIQTKYWMSLEVHGGLLFQNYCYQLPKQLLKILQDQPLVCQNVIQRTKNLSLTQNNQLLKSIKDVNALTSLADQLVKQGNHIGALRLCLENGFSSPQIERKIYHLVCQPQILLDYRYEKKQEVYQLLSKNYDKFQDLIILLTFERDPKTGLKQIKKILKIYKGESRFSKSLDQRVLNIIKSKLQMCIGNWIVENNGLFLSFKRDEDLFAEVRQILKDTEFIEYLDI